MAGTGIKLETGHVLDQRYLLENVIGQGGMGTVFAARHLELGEIVAVKVLQAPSESGGAVSEEHIERFLREARLAAKIKNEHVVKVIDVARGKHGSPPYIVMELLEGQDLSDLVRAFGRVPIPDAVGYVLQACEALAEAHSLGIVHRDLKSSNLHVSHRADGSPLVKILDFGISKMHDDDDGDTKLTTTAAVFGSPAYMSPEQIRSAKHVDHRTDVWAMAVVLYEILTADLPFLGDNASAMLAAISADRHTPIARFVPNVPPGLELAMAAALTKDREKRTQTIAAFAESIAPFAHGSAGSTLAAIRHLSARPRALEQSASRSHGSMRPPPTPAIGPVSDTLRASSPLGQLHAQGGAFGATVPLETPRHAAVSRTDRDAGAPPQRISPALLAIVSGIAFAGLASIAFAVYVLRRPTAIVVAPQPPGVSVVAGAPEPPPSAQSLPAALELPSGDPVSSSSAPHRPRAVPHPSAPRPHATTIDTNARE